MSVMGLLGFRLSFVPTICLITVNMVRMYGRQVCATQVILVMAVMALFIRVSNSAVTAVVNLAKIICILNLQSKSFN